MNVLLSNVPAPSGVVRPLGTRRSPAAAPPSPWDGLEPGARDVARRLTEHGASEAFTAKVVESIGAGGARGAYAIDTAARLLGRLCPILRSPRREAEAGTPLYAFVGAPGAGKTTVLTRLARHLQSSKKSVVAATLDPLGIGVHVGLGGVPVDGDRTDVPVRTVQDGLALRRLARRHDPSHAFLLDTPGLAPGDEEAIARLADELLAVGQRLDPRVLVVLPASASRRSLKLTLDAFAPLRPAGAVVTGLDTTDAPGTVLEELATRRLPVALFGAGRDLTSEPRRPRPDDFADLFLRGRIA